MKFRQWSIIAAVLILVGGFFAFKAFSDMATPPARQEIKPAKRLVPVQRVQLGTNAITIPVTGKLEAKERIQLFAEVNGRFLYSANDFKPGNAYTKGEVLLQLDKREAELALIAEKSNFLNTVVQLLPDVKLDFPKAFDKWSAFADDIDVNKPLPALPEFTDPKEKLFVSARQLLPTYYRIQSQENRLSKFSIYANFTGVLTQASVEKGTLIRAGQKLGEFINISSFELRSAVSQDEVAYLNLGAEVMLYSKNKQHKYRGRVSRISKSINPATQSVDVYISLSDPDLFEGQYLSGSIQSTEIDSSFSLARKLIDEKNQVYGVKDSAIVVYQVEPVFEGTKNAIVKGIPNQVLLLEDRLNGVYEGMPVNPLVSQAE